MQLENTDSSKKFDSRVETQEELHINQKCQTEQRPVQQVQLFQSLQLYCTKQPFRSSEIRRSIKLNNRLRRPFEIRTRRIPDCRRIF